LRRVGHATDDAFAFAAKISQEMTKTSTVQSKLPIFGNLDTLKEYQRWYLPENAHAKNHTATKTIASVTEQV